MFQLSVEQMAAALAPEPQRALVLTNLGICWPFLRGSLKALEICTTPAIIAALATIRVESPSFRPQTEKYNGDPITYFEQKYGNRLDLGNIHPGDGYKFRGRGLIQITGRSNYTNYGRAIAVDLVNNPDRALELAIAVDILVAFFAGRGIAGLAEAGNWESVRRRVNGGLNGYDEFLGYVTALQAAVGLQPPAASEPPPAPASS
jgi:hypothetical protein